MTPHEEFIQEHESTIVSIISQWIPQSSQHFDQKVIESKKWFKNFKPSQCYLALKLLEKIQYVSDEDIRDYIRTSADQIKKIFNHDLSNILFYPLGDSSASSGGQFLYEYGIELGLKDENFKSDDFRTHLHRDTDIVFFDDIIGSGNQATKFFNKNLEKSKARCHYIALLGFEAGIKAIRMNAGFHNLVACKHLSDEEMAFSGNSWVFKESSEKQEIEKLCREYGERLYPEHPLGYDNSQALIVLPYNTPNNTLPVIWAGSKSESNAEEIWHPVWARKKQSKQERKSSAISGAIAINQKFVSDQRGKNFSPYEFYTSKLNNDCQWHGIIQQWDGKRDILEELVSQIIESFGSNIDMRVSAIVSGPGGCGKSILLRRVAVNLALSDISVLWIVDADEFYQHSLLQLQNTPGKCLVIVEDWYRFEDNSTHLNDLYKELTAIDTVRLLIGDRTTHNKIYLKYLFNPNNNLYALTTQENDRIIKGIIERVPEWETAFESLRQANDYKSITLFLLLFILARTAKSGKSSELIDKNLMSHFRAIVQNDVRTIEHLSPGIAMALTWWAGTYKDFQLQLGEHDFYLLADFFGETSENSQYLSFDVNSEVNKLLYVYISATTSDFKLRNNIQLLTFNHDTLAEEGLSYAVLESGDPNSHLQQAKVLDYAVSTLSHRTASGLLTFRLREKNFFRDKQQKFDLIEKLSARGCTYHGYLKYLIIGFDIPPEERKNNALSLLKRHESRPLSTEIVCNCLTALQTYARSESVKAARALLEKNKTARLAHQIVCNCLTILRKYARAEAAQAAIALLKENEATLLNQEIICACLAILQGYSREAIKFSIALLDKNKTTPLSYQVICSCLGLLRQDAREDAIKAAIILLEKNKTTPLAHPIVCACLRILQEGMHEEAIKAAVALLEGHEVTSLNIEIVCTCLTIFQKYAPDEAVKAATTLLEKNKTVPLAHQIVCSCLRILQESTHEAVKAVRVAIDLLEKNEATPLVHTITCNCLRILQEFSKKEAVKQAIVLLKKNNDTPLSHTVVCNCLRILQESMPEEAVKTAIALLKKNEITPLVHQIVCNCLRILQESTHEDAVDIAMTLSQKTPWQDQNWNVVYRCLGIFAAFETDNPIVTEIISDYNCYPNSSQVFNRYNEVLRLPFLSNKSWENAVTKHINAWKYKSRKPLINILKALEKHPDRTVVTCKEILRNWRGEIDFQLEKNNTVSFWQHIRSSITHPLLVSSPIAISAAKQIIAYDEKNAEVLPHPLLESCRELLE